LVLCAESQGDEEFPCPALIGEKGNLTSGLKAVPGKPCHFSGSSQVLRLSAENDHGATLEPIHTMRGDRKYVVYWNAMTAAEWQGKLADYQALKARTVDRVQPGNEASEREHGFQGAHTGTDGSRWRDAFEGGWFSWELQVLAGRAQELRVKYWGGDSGGREFDILAGGEKVATVKLENNKPGEYYEETYSIPPQVTEGRSRITVKFQAHPGKMAGGVFGCAMMVRSQSPHR
jgi:hypothetical protein